jgi:hypothetical protein
LRARRTFGAAGFSAGACEFPRSPLQNLITQRPAPPRGRQGSSAR